MMKNTTVSLEILILNELLTKKAIDNDIYEKAVKKIIKTDKNKS